MPLKSRPPPCGADATPQLLGRQRHVNAGAMPSVEAPEAVSRRRAWLGTDHESRDDDGSEGVSARGDGVCTLASPPLSRARAGVVVVVVAERALSVLLLRRWLLAPYEGRHDSHATEERVGAASAVPIAGASISNPPRAARRTKTSPACPAAPRGPGGTCGRPAYARRLPLLLRGTLCSCGRAAASSLASRLPAR